MSSPCPVAQGVPRLAARVKKHIRLCGGQHRQHDVALPRRGAAPRPSSPAAFERDRRGRLAPALRHRSERPIAGPPSVARNDWPTLPRQRCEFCFAAGEVERREAVLGGDLPDMRVVDDDEVVCRASSSTGKVSKSCSERLSQAIPTPVFSMPDLAGRDHRVIAARMAPGHPLRIVMFTSRILRGSRRCARRSAAPRGCSARAPSTRIGERVVAIATPSSRVTVCSMSSALKPRSPSAPASRAPSRTRYRPAPGSPASARRLRRDCSAMMRLMASRVGEPALGFSR